MKKIYSLLLVLCALLLPVEVRADDSGSCGETVTYIYVEATKTLTISGTGPMTDYTSSYEPWYGYKDFIINVIIDNGVTTIGNYAFYKCSRLVSIEIPNSVTTIGSCAFYGCSSLSSIEIPNSVTTIGGGFSGCSSLSSIEIPSGVGRFECSFTDCNSLTSLSFSCATSVFISDAKSLQSVIFRNDMPYFMTTCSIKGCSSLTSITIPYSATGIIIQNCSNLTDVYCYADPEDVGIFDCSFNKEKALTFHVLKKSVWEESYPVANVTYTEDLEPLPCIVSGECGSGLTYSFYGDKRTLMIEKTGEGTGMMTDYVSSSDIPWRYSFSPYQPFKDLIIGEGVKSIGNLSFWHFRFNSIALPNSLISIGWDAFSGCEAFDMNHELSSIIIPENVTEIGYRAFSYCREMTSVVIPNSVVRIESRSFMGCNRLSTVKIGSGVTYIGSESFYDCKALADVYCDADPMNLIWDSNDKEFKENKETLFHVHKKKKWEKKFPEANVTFVEDIRTITTAVEIIMETLQEEDLYDNVIENIYYNLNPETDNGYDLTDGSIVIGETTNMEQIVDATPGSSDIVNNFTGLILKVAAGKGTIKVNVKTTGNAQLVVQVGNQTPMIATKTEQGDVVVSYDVTEDTYVYIYAIIGSSNAPAHRAAPADAVKIYGITVLPGVETGIGLTPTLSQGEGAWYTLDGRKLEGVPTKKGIYIQNGRKVVI